MDKGQIMVSIICNAYNQEKYIGQCLEGFVKQKTSFAFEVLIHDDASTDSTASVIREYEKKYPDIIKPIYQTENQYSKKVPISRTFHYPRARGKYYALCEGDDYWTDENKLQLQFDAMEQNPSCSICTHIVKKVDVAGRETGENIPAQRTLSALKGGVIKQEEFFGGVIGDGNYYPFHTTSFFYRKSILDDYLKVAPQFTKVISVGDVPLMFYMFFRGDVYFIDKAMSCYRVNVPGSWNRREMADNASAIKHYNELIAFNSFFDEFTGKKYTAALNKGILSIRYAVAVLNEDYKALAKKEFKDLRRRESFKRRACIRIYAAFPWLKTIRQRNKK